MMIWTQRAIVALMQNRIFSKTTGKHVRLGASPAPSKRGNAPQWVRVGRFNSVRAYVYLVVRYKEVRVVHVKRLAHRSDEESCKLPLVNAHRSLHTYFTNGCIRCQVGASVAITETGTRECSCDIIMAKKVYLFDPNVRTAQGGFAVSVGHADANGTPQHIEALCPTQSQALINHSPNGFNWGYGGSGPAQCALGILLDVTGNEAVALRWYQDFKREVIAHIPTDKKMQIAAAKIQEWLDTKLESTDTALQ